MNLGRIICALPKWAGGGHKRGKPVDRKEDFAVGPLHLMPDRTHQTFECPRCHHETRYKVKPKPDSNNGAPTDGSAHFQEAT